MKVIIFDPVSTGKSHYTFNNTMIKIITEANNISSVRIILSQSHFLKLHSSETSESTKIKNIHGINYSKINKTRFHFLVCSVIAYLHLIRKIIKYNPKSLFILAADNLYSPFFLLIIKFIFNINIYVFLHNNLENVKNSNFKKKLLIKILNNGVKGICLSKFVMRNANQLLNNNSNLLYFPHPSYSHLFKERASESYKCENDFLLLGRHSVFFTESNFHKKIFSVCEDLNSQKSIVFSIRKNCLQKKQSKNIEITEYDFPMNDEEYCKLLFKSKFLIIPPQSASRITASGVHIDAISAGIPVIAPELGTFAENVSVLGKSLLYNEENLKEVFKRALLMTNNDYENLCKELVKTSELLSLNRSTSLIEKMIFNK